MIDPAKLSGYLPDWGDWKMHRPRERAKDATDAVHVPMPFGPKLPGPVWMTPHALVIDYHEVTVAFEQLPEVPYLVIAHTYLELMKQAEMVRLMGLKWETITLNRRKAIDLMAARLCEMKRIRKVA